MKERDVDKKRSVKLDGIEAMRKCKLQVLILHDDPIVTTKEQLQSSHESLCNSCRKPIPNQEQKEKWKALCSSLTAQEARFSIDKPL